MKREHLESAAAVLAETNLAQVTGKPVTADSLQHDIDALLGQDANAVALNFYRGIAQVVLPFGKAGHSLEVLLRLSLTHLDETVLSNLPRDQRWATAFVMGSLASVKAVIDCIEKRPTSAESRRGAPAAQRAANVTVSGIIETIDWRMKKADVLKGFLHMTPLPPHPTQSAVGFTTTVDGIPCTVVCYFGRALLKERLAAVNIVLYDDPPSPEQLNRTLSAVVDELTARYGAPKVANQDCKTWIIPRAVLAVTTLTGVLGIRIGDPKIDPPSRMAIGTDG